MFSFQNFDQKFWQTDIRKDQPEQRHTQNTSTMNSIIAGIHNECDDTFYSKLINKGKELKEDSKTNSSRRK